MYPQLTAELGKLGPLFVIKHVEEPVQILRVLPKGLSDPFTTGVGQVHQNDTTIELTLFPLHQGFPLEAIDGRGDRPAGQQYLFANAIDRERALVEQYLQHGIISQGTEARLADAALVVVHDRMIGLPEKEKEVGAGVLVDFRHDSQHEGYLS